MADIDESFGTMPEATLEERIEAGRKLAGTLTEKVEGYTYRLKSQQSTKDPGETYVNLYINGRAGSRPGRIGIGRYATPIVFPGNDETDTEAFVNAVDQAGIKLKVYTVTAD
jgi:hypothetical protein